MPYAVTSILPLAFFPLAGVLPGDKVGLNYFKVRMHRVLCKLAAEHVRF